jgi:integrase
MVPRWDKTKRRWVASKAVDGKPVRAYSTDTDGSQAVEKLKEKLARLGAPSTEDEDDDPFEVTVGEVVTRWRNEQLSTTKKLTWRTVAQYRWACDAIIASKHFAAIKIETLSREQVQRFLQNSLDRWGHNSCRLVKGRMASAIDWYIDGQPPHKRTLLYNAARKATIPVEATDPVEGRSLTIEELERFEEELPGSPLEQLFGFGEWTGCRRGELIGLPWTHVDFETGKAHIWQQLTKSELGGWELAPLKNDRSKRRGRRTISLAPEAIAYLKARQVAQKQEKLARGPSWHNDHDLVFTSPTGAHMDPRVVTREWVKLRIAANLPEDTVPHSLRHTFASHAAKSGVPVPVIAAQLGDSENTVTRYYLRDVSDVADVGDPYAKARATKSS